MQVVALIAKGEDIGTEMSLWQFNHLVSDYHTFFYSVNLSSKMLYGEPTIWIAVPLAIGLISASNPQLPILDTLSECYPYPSYARSFRGSFTGGGFPGTLPQRLSNLWRSGPRTCLGKRLFSSPLYIIVTTHNCPSRSKNTIVRNSSWSPECKSTHSLYK